MDSSTIKCDEIIESYAKLNPKDDNEETKTTFNEEKGACKIYNFYILFTSLLIIVALLIAISTYCYLIRYSAKQKHLLKQVYINNIN